MGFLEYLKYQFIGFLIAVVIAILILIILGVIYLTKK